MKDTVLGVNQYSATLEQIKQEHGIDIAIAYDFEDVDRLLAEIERLKKKNKELREQYDSMVRQKRAI